VASPYRGAEVAAIVTPRVVDADHHIARRRLG
jgi:hypothetical protein